MTDERELGRELLKHDPAPTAPTQDAARIVRRARIRLRFLAGGSLLLWLIVAGVFVAFHVCFLVFLMPLVHATAAEITQGLNERAAARLATLMSVLPQYILYGTITWAVLLALAAAFTILYVQASRRATLRQIQASLDEVAQQLRQLAVRT